jgi:hypothetical protein
MYRKFWVETLREGEHLGDLSVDGQKLLRYILKEIIFEHFY